MKKQSGEIRIGISDWTYKPWRGVFYPEGLPQKQWPMPPNIAERAGSPSPPRAHGRDVYVYFDNDVKVRAPRDARALAERLDAGPTSSIVKTVRRA